MTTSLEATNDNAAFQLDGRFKDELEFSWLSPETQALYARSTGTAALYLGVELTDEDKADVASATQDDTEPASQVPIEQMLNMRSSQNNVYLNFLRTQENDGRAYNAFYETAERPVAAYVLALFNEPADVDSEYRKSRFSDPDELLANALDIDPDDESSAFFEDVAIIAGRFAADRTINLDNDGFAEPTVDRLAVEFTLYHLTLEAIKRIREYGADETVIDALISRIDTEVSDSQREKTNRLIAELTGNRSDVRL